MYTGSIPVLASTIRYALKIIEKQADSRKVDTKLDTKSATILDYHPSTLNRVKGKYYVYVTVPKSLEHLFSQKQIRRSTGTSDLKLAKQAQHAITQDIYQKLEAEARKEVARAAADEFRSKKQKEEHYFEILQKFADAVADAFSEDLDGPKQINVRHTMEKSTLGHH